MPRPSTGEYASFFQRYINYTEGNDARLLLRESLQPLRVFLNSIPESKASYAYAADKWTVLQVLQHAIDTERVLAYRALCISRGEQQPLPGFDENAYADSAPAANRTLADLAEEFLLVRQTTILLYQYMHDEALYRLGTASGHPINPNAIAFIIVGHTLHHQKILAERYFVAE